MTQEQTTAGWNWRVIGLPRPRLRHLALILLALIALLGAAGYLIYHHQTQVFNFAVGGMVDPLKITVGEISFSELGTITARKVQVEHPSGDGKWLEIEQVDIRYDADEILDRRRARSIHLRAPVVKIDDAVIDGFKGGDDAPSEADAELDLGVLGTITDELVVEDGRADVALSGLPPMRFAFDVSARGLSSVPGDDLWISSQPLGIHLTEVEVGRAGEEQLLTADGIETEFHLGRHGRVVEAQELKFERPLITITPLSLSSLEGPESTDAEALEEVAAPSVEPSDTEAGAALSVRLKQFGIDDGQFDLRGFERDGPVLPDIAFNTSVAWQDIVIDADGVRSTQELHWVLEDLRADGALAEASIDDKVALLRAAAVEARFSPQELILDRRLAGLTVRRPEITASERGLSRFLAAESEQRTGQDETSEKPSSAPFQLGQLSIVDGRFDLEGFQIAEDGPWLPDLATGFAAEFQELTIAGSDGVVRSSQPQTVRLAELRLNGGALDTNETLLRVAGLELEFRPTELVDKGEIDRLAIQSPSIVVTDQTLSRWSVPEDEQVSRGSKDHKTSAVERPVSTQDANASLEPVIWSIHDLQVSDGSFLTNVVEATSGIPWLQGQFDVQTVAPEARDTAYKDLYRVGFADLRVRPATSEQMASPGAEEIKARARSQISRRDAAFVRDVVFELSPSGIQRHRRIEKLFVSGGTIRLGNQFQALMDGGDEQGAQAQEKAPTDQAQQSTDAIASAAEDDHTPWRIDELQISSSIVRLEEMVPQIDGLEFSVETTLKDVPLSEEGLASQDQLQKLELVSIDIRDPYDGLRAVAFLPTIFLEFSLAGLVNKEIEKIDLIGPVLYVGEPLFNWVEYQRKHWAGNEGDATGGDSESGGWTVKHLNAYHGKNVIAPVGSPIGIVPFPFSISTNLEHGELALELQIPEEQYVYSFPALKLNLFGLSGEVAFNVPIRHKDNNLVQTFELDRLVWRNYDAEELFLTVTYDANGIYGKLGGKAYEGYINGEFNIYLKELGQWDGWLSGVEVNMEPITQVLAPDNFVMAGLVSAKLQSNGNGMELGTTSGDLDVLTPGRIEITKLDELIKELPEEWTQLKLSMSRMALEGLKTFEYDQGKGTVELENRDGLISLHLSGPNGSRVFDIFLHDMRTNKGAADDVLADTAAE